MKTFLHAAATLALVAGTAIGSATAAPFTATDNANPGCMPGMTAATPGACTLPGYHWEFTMVHQKFGDQTVWMLLPNG